jgi:hypothetical protein
MIDYDEARAIVAAAKLRGLIADGPPPAEVGRPPGPHAAERPPAGKRKVTLGSCRRGRTGPTTIERI